MGKGLNKILNFDSKFNNNPNLQKTDKRLRWKPDEHGQIRKIRADRSQVWIPDVEIVNRIHDFSPSDEKPSKLQIEIDGRVTYTRFFIFQISQINQKPRLFRMRANVSPSIYTYPYDIQIAIIQLASTDYASSKVKVFEYYFHF